MALFNRVTVWVSNQVLTSSALNGEFNNILNNAKLASWVGFSANASQMQQQTSPGSVGSESLASSGSDELQRLRFMVAYALGTTYWYDQTGSNFSAGGIQTAALAAGAVTRPKLAALGQQVGTPVTVNVTTSGVITGLTVTITTTGRPVAIYQYNGSITYTAGGNLGVSSFGTITTIRDVTTLNSIPFRFGSGSSSGSSNETITLSNQLLVIDTGAGAGSHTYTFNGNVSNAGDIMGINCGLLAFEL